MTTAAAVRHRSAVDVVVSIALLGLAMFALLASAIGDLVPLAFTDSCLPQTCDQPLGMALVFSCLSVGAAVLVVGSIVTIVRLVRRRRGWIFAAATWVIVIASGVLGFALYTHAVGYA